MSVLRRIGQFASGVLRKVGQIGTKVLSGVGNVKAVADQSGLTGVLQTALMSNPATMPLAAGLAAANPIINGAKALTSAMSKVS